MRQPVGAAVELGVAEALVGVAAAHVGVHAGEPDLLQPIGGDVASTWDGLIAGRNGIKINDASWTQRFDLPSKLTAQLAAEHRSIAAGVGNAGAYGVIDAVIPRAATRRAIADRHPRGRWSEPDDAARLIAWLCSDEARWVTGQTIVSDGGAWWSP